MAGNHDCPDDGRSLSAAVDRWRDAKTKEPKKNITARDSNGGVCKVCIARDGHVAQSGIAKAPTHVHVLGESVRRLIDGGLRAPNHSVVLDIVP